MKNHHSDKLHLFIGAIAILACLVMVFLFLKEGTSAMLTSNATVLYTPISYTLPDVWYGDGYMPFRVSLPSGFVAERYNTEAPDWSDELRIRTKADFDIVRTKGSEYGEWRPAITFEQHSYAGAKQTPLQWAKAHFADVPSNPAIIKIDGRDGIKYTKMIEGKTMTVYVFNVGIVTDNLPTGGSIMAVIATGSVTNAQLNAVMNSIKFYP